MALIGSMPPTCPPVSRSMRPPWKRWPPMRAIPSPRTSLPAAEMTWSFSIISLRWDVFMAGRESTPSALSSLSPSTAATQSFAAMASRCSSSPATQPSLLLPVITADRNTAPSSAAREVTPSDRLATARSESMSTSPPAITASWSSTVRHSSPGTR